MSLTFYVAGSSGRGEDIQAAIQILKKRGHQISFDWTAHPTVKPYEKNELQAREFAERALDGAKDCDVFILFPEREGGTTQFTELGAAIFSSRVQKIFVVGLFNGRSLAFFHPRVIRVEGLEAIWQQL
jgi:hypothetical protein